MNKNKQVAKKTTNNKPKFNSNSKQNFKRNSNQNSNSKAKAKFSNKVHDTRIGIDLNKQLEKHQTGLQNDVFVFSSVLSVTDFARKINKTAADVIRFLFTQKRMAVNINTILTEDQIGELCLEFGYDFEKRIEEVTEENILNYLSVNDDEATLKVRPPIVTVMGHVDHGKTSLLDKIRSANVISTEHGGITQHIGSYQVVHNKKKIVFLDTPGHEAFTKMRARGASVTDIVVLVVAADDGVKTQTIEALNHALAAKVKIIVFINKMDRPGANPDLIEAQLYEHGLAVESQGGEILCITGSAKQNQGITDLLEAILFVAELMNLKANPKRLAYGTVIEANLDKGYGPIATLLVQNGTLMKGDYLVINSTTGRVRTMMNDRLQPIEHADPSTPVRVAGLLEVPKAGDKFLALKSEKEAKIIHQKISEKKWKDRIYTLLNVQAQQASNEGSDKKVNIIIKTDVHGSLEAIKGSLEKLNVEKVNLIIINSTAGSINESDLQLAKVSRAVIFGFNVKPNKQIREMAAQNEIMIRFHNIIYNLIDEVGQLLLGALDPIEVETILGEAEVQKLWRHSSIGTIAGCKVVSGKINRNNRVRLIRDGVVIYTSKIKSLKHGKEDAREALVNTECGIVIENYQDIKENDIIEVFEIKIETQHKGLGETEKKKKKK